ncbi:hypothetical protein [Sphingomonas sp. ACRSK]|uniref:hypothetical protein n=1 Tax=Sphingomonas sp. ACRSK TaxID=2918213 RepID=UPI001EF6389A|nr:hypothetical protein [Sphingomonas sp. ACRSK]MCG7347878.1 hypothetical protein [Sphingomonas sp. ACRSK]
MTSPLGENIQREWDNEPLSDELWDALEAKKSNQATGLAMLTDLASGGSALAMMYLGHACVTDNGQASLVLGEEWLKRSADAGSIEGRLQLAVHYQRQERWTDAEAELRALVAQDYAPGMYALGHLLYARHSGQKSVSEAIRYLKLAKAAGHLPATGLLSWIYRKEKFGLRGRVISHWHCAAKIPSAIWYLWRYPNSDRLRRG